MACHQSIVQNIEKGGCGAFMSCDELTWDDSVEGREGLLHDAEGYMSIEPTRGEGSDVRGCRVRLGCMGE